MNLIPVLKKFFYISVLTGFTTTIAAAQELLKLQLLDNSNKQPVAYANVGIPGTDRGVNSDSLGWFELNVPANAQDKQLAVSMIGYEDQQIAIAILRSQLQQGNPAILLKPVPNTLQEVIVKPAKLTAAQLGNDLPCSVAVDSKGALPFPFIYEKKKKGVVVKSDTLTEIGTLMKVKRKKTFVDSVKINVGNCTHRELLYRLNVYEETGDEFKNVLQEPIYIRLKQEEVGNAIVVNLQDRNIVVNHNFIVSIERVKDLGSGAFSICGKMFGAAMYMRVASIQERFIKLPVIGMGISAYVTFSEEEK